MFAIQFGLQVCVLKVFLIILCLIKTHTSIKPDLKKAYVQIIEIAIN